MEDGISRRSRCVPERFVRRVEPVTVQMRADVANLHNRSEFAGPGVSPTSSPYGKVQAQTSSLNLFYQCQAGATL